MKKKFGLFALVLAVLLCGSLFLLAACDETEEDPADTPATISVTVNGTAQTSGGTYNATVGTAYTFAATASNGNAVTISYVFGDAEAEELEGTSFTPETAGSYAFTFTAEDATSFTLTFNVAAAHTHSYVWSVKPGDEPLQSDGTATGLCSCGDETTRTLPLMTQENMVEDAAAVGKYFITYTQQGSCTQATIAEIVYTFDDNVTVTFTLSEPAHGHNAYQVEIAYDAEKMQSEWTATVRCPNCGDTMEVTVPAVDASDTANWEKAEGMSGSGATCTEPGKATYQYETEQNGEIVIVYVSGVTDPEAPASGHDYQISYTGGTVTAHCTFGDFEVSAEVTISGGGATGETVLSEKDFSIDKEGKTFTVTLPENGYTYDGHTFSGWLVGGKTYTEGQTVTVAAGNTLAIVAQWTAVNVPQISLDVKVDGQYSITTTDGGNTTACVGTNIHYIASVSEGQVTVSYTLGDGDAQSLPAEGDFTFAAAGTYIFVITASGADDYTFTVNVKEHEWEAWEVTSAPSDSETGEISRTCLVTNHTFSLSVPVLTEGNVTDSNEEGKYTVETVDATCTESGSATYIYNIPSEYGGDTIVAEKVTLPQLEHSFTGAEATVDAATGNIIQTCTSCGTATNTLATLTGLSVGWAESAQGWYTVGGTINASDFVVTYTYEGDVAAYEDIIKAAITNNITQLSTAQTGLVTVTFTLGDTDASIDVMVYAADEANGAKVLSAQEGTVTSVKGTGYSVDAISSAATEGISVSFWYTGYYDLISDWHTVLLTNGSYTITLPNVGSRYPDWDGGTNWRNGGLYMNSTYENANSFVTVTFSADGNVSFYWNGVMRIQYVASETYADTTTVGDYVSGLLSAIASSGFTFGYGIVEEVVSGIAADDLFITAALTDAQVAALYAAYQASAAFPIAKLDTAALLNGVTGVTVYASADRDFAANERYGLAANAGYTDGISISFNLTAMGVESWASIIIGSVVDLDVCLAVLDAHLNTADGLSEAMNIWLPTSGDREYYMSATLGGLVTVTLGEDGSVAYYYYDGEAYTQVCYYAGTETMNLVDGATGGPITVSQFVSALLTNIAEYGCDLLEGVAASDLLVTSALDAKQAAALYNNYQSLNA